MAPQIRSIAVLGAGTMGHGIAQIAAGAGYDVQLYDVDLEAATTGLGRIRANLDKGIRLGKVTDAHRDATIARIQVSERLAGAVQDVDLVIEAAPESMELKSRIFEEVSDQAPERAVLASNTSSLSVTEIAASVRTPERFIGLHFFNPVHIMRLVEVVWGERTSEATRTAAVDFVRSLDKAPVVVRDSPGFASSRLGIILGMEAIRMVEEGVASAEDIDTAMELGYRHPMGPLKLTDLVGLDVRLGIAEYLHRTLGSEAFEPPALLRRLVAEGKLGRKSGQGFYDWSEEA